MLLSRSIPIFARGTDTFLPSAIGYGLLTLKLFGEINLDIPCAFEEGLISSRLTGKKLLSFFVFLELMDLIEFWGASDSYSTPSSISSLFSHEASWELELSQLGSRVIPNSVKNSERTNYFLSFK